MEEWKCNKETNKTYNNKEWSREFKVKKEKRKMTTRVKKGSTENNTKEEDRRKERWKSGNAVKKPTMHTTIKNGNKGMTGRRKRGKEKH